MDHSPHPCFEDIKYCAPGNQMRQCPSGHSCIRCSDDTFQPDKNVFGDKCRFKRQCDMPFMRYRDYGSAVKDADCECQPGYHTENEDQRACVMNEVCDRGYGQGYYGVCENCFNVGKYSDAQDRIQKCQPLTNCRQQGRCTVLRTDGTRDNECGPIVEDVSKCEEYPAAASSSQAIIIGVVIALLAVIVVAILTTLLLRNRRRRKKHNSMRQRLDAIYRYMMERARKDESFCKTVFNTAIPMVDKHIGNMKWNLASELFPVSSKYEYIVETYSDPAEYTVRNYMIEWQKCQAETTEPSDSLALLLHALNKCNPDGCIIKKMYKALGGDKEVRLDIPDKAEHQTRRSSLVKSLLPCLEPPASPPRDIEKNSSLLTSNGVANNSDYTALPRLHHCSEINNTNIRCMPTAPVDDDRDKYPVEETGDYSSEEV